MNAADATALSITVSVPPQPSQACVAAWRVAELSAVDGDWEGSGVGDAVGADVPELTYRSYICDDEYA